ncbi:MAG: metal ABC transporter permease [Thermoproteota archaeon]|nr:metal ABC transporter permease [Thermoproteota archaeon]
MVFEILTFGFMQRALVAGVMIATICSIIGLFLVLKRHSLFGDAMSHVAFGGIAIGLFTNVYPLWTAFIVSVLAALGMTKLREFTKIPADSAVAVLLSSGLAIGVVLISLSGGFKLDLFSFLFGSILLVSVQDLIMILVVSSIVLIIISLIYKRLTYVTFDEEQAAVGGLSVKNINYLFIVIASITVIASIRLVGVLLISSLIVLPNITAITMGKGFKKTAIISCGISVSSVIVGIIVSYIMNIAPSGAIVLTATAIFLTAVLGRHIVRKIRRSDINILDVTLSD